ncbi:MULTISPECIES: hypothetical protein [Flavobacteriaceae]|uniref:Uncharacterized protein n=1 Tax=Arenibacter algicola TaxID=616991 RepID=A0A221V5M0_9FLAO|nr:MULTISPECIES: hypothetical protein [Flavobacteriaceae]ASO08381.1 hypothetical protein AREALGSMS7_05006 [Arenibacter algicola]MBC74001.1 hypothetical protein [Allomuricauda sp.]USD27008.1 hypothetical protein MJO53_16650 [Allomuricauda aquimarina]
MGKRVRTYPEIQTGQLWSVNGQVYELVDMRVTAVESPTKFLTTVFFRSKDPNSENPFFEEKVKTVLSDPIFKRHIFGGRRELEEWLQDVPGGVSTRLYNILRGLCKKEFNGMADDVSPFELTKEGFLALDGAGKKSWEEFERAKKVHQNENPKKRKF